MTVAVLPVGQPGATPSLPEVTFLATGAGPPASALYVRADDSLLVRVGTFENLAQGILLEARVLRPNGTITPFERLFTPAANRVYTSSIFTLGEGWLLAFAFDLQGQISRRGATWATVALQRLSGALGVPHQVLFQNYLLKGHRQGWPGSPIITSIEGPGLLRPLITGTPGAGQEIGGSSQTNARLRLVCITFTLTTSVTVANRVVSITITDDSSRTQVKCSAPNLQAASSTVLYSAYIAAAQTTGFGGGRNIALPDRAWILPNWTWQTVTDQLQVGDQYTAAAFTQEELAEEP